MFNTRNIPIIAQYLISIIGVLFIASGCYFASGIISHREVALILLMTVSFTAMLFEIWPVLSAAVLSAVIWNFFFIPPLYTFHIHKAEDILLFLLYFLIALINAVLTFKIKEAEKKARDKEEKEKTIKLYNTLLNSLSHELKTPITTVLGAVDTLMEGEDKLSKENQTALLEQINISSIRLNRQVENLLNMSRLESGMLKPKTDWCDVNELINMVIQKFIADKKHQLIFNADENIPLFKLDSGLIEQVLHNIIHNAIQYTPENSTIEITTKYDTTKLNITISDNGKGFPEDEIKMAFDKFYRLPNTQTGGSGLGLSIVKGFIEAQRGTITLQNNAGGGSKFVIEIPAETSFLNNLKNE